MHSFIMNVNSSTLERLAKMMENQVYLYYGIP